jgi:hypothetical protein
MPVPSRFGVHANSSTTSRCRSGSVRVVVVMTPLSSASRLPRQGRRSHRTRTISPIHKPYRIRRAFGEGSCNTEGNQRAWICPDLVLPRRSRSIGRRRRARVTHPLVDRSPDSGLDTSTGDSPASVPCLYCRAAIMAQSFTYWSAAKRLLSAVCPTCERCVTLAASTWRRSQTSGPEVSWPG